MGKSSLTFGILCVMAATAVSAATAKTPLWTPEQVAEQVATLPVGGQAVTCKVASKPLNLYRCGKPDGSVVWARVRQFGSGSVCASLRKPVPAGCWTVKDGERDLVANGIDAFRSWRAGGSGLDQAGSSCVGYGSGFFICTDVPVNGDIPKPVKASVVMSVSGPRVTQIR